MKPSFLWNAIFLACLVTATLSAMLGGAAVMQYWAIVDGNYDPVADDGLAPELVPALKTRLLRIAIISGGVLLVSLPYFLYRLRHVGGYNHGAEQHP
jgi:hypothetical protein